MPNRAFIREVGLGRWAARWGWRQFCKRVLRKDQTIRLPTGTALTLPRESRFASEVYVTNCRVDWGSESLFSALVAGDGCFFDVGANIGYYSLYLSPRVRQVFAFEPDRRARKSLEANAARTSNVVVVPSAVSNFVGKSAFGEAGSTELSRLEDSTDKGTYSVDVTTIDQFIADHRVTLLGLKIDAEGADFEIIQGARETLASQRPIVLTETNASAELFALLNQVGYAVYAFAKAGSERARFQVVTKDTQGLQTKMLFLLPQERTLQALELSRTCL